MSIILLMDSTRIDQESWIFDLYELEDGFTLDDLFDEVGLGSNPPSTPQRISCLWYQMGRETKRNCTKEKIQSWLDGISHSLKLIIH